MKSIPCFVEFTLLGVEFELHEYFIYLFYTSVKLLIRSIEPFRDRRNGATGLILDEDISPRVAEILRKRGVDAVSAHDVGKAGASDEDQFAEAVSRKAAIVTRNRDDFITLTVQAFENTRPHHGLVVVSHSISGSDFRRVVGMLEKCAKKNPTKTQA